MAVAMTLVVFVGFARSFYLDFWFDPDQLTTHKPVFHVHGVIYTAWMGLLIVQPFLIRIGHVAQHRKLGILGALIAVGVVVTGVLVGLEAAARPNSPKSLDFLGVILFGLLMFGLLVGFAIGFRHKNFLDYCK